MNDNETNDFGGHIAINNKLTKALIQFFIVNKIKEIHHSNYNDRFMVIKNEGYIIFNHSKILNVLLQTFFKESLKLNIDTFNLADILKSDFYMNMTFLEKLKDEKYSFIFTSFDIYNEPGNRLRLEFVIDDEGTLISNKEIHLQ